MEMIVLRIEDLDAVLGFESAVLDRDGSLDDMEKQMKSWHARWRKEALEHYLGLGWSFGIWSDSSKSELLGYVLCQPLLFFRGLTQTLWVEHLNGQSDAVKQTLGEIVYRWARDKHLQQVILPADHQSIVSVWNPKPFEEHLITVNTSKMRN